MLTQLFKFNSSLSDHSHQEFARNMCPLNSFRMRCIFTYFSDESTFTAHAGMGQSPLQLCHFMELKWCLYNLYIIPMVVKLQLSEALIESPMW